MKSKKGAIEFHYYWADLIDRFNRAHMNEKLEISESFPYPDDEFITGDKIHSAHIAGAVEELCRRDNIRIPKWVNEKKYFLNEPDFGGDLENIKAFLFVESPIGFKRRNIFVSDNALVRV